jgi:hypothetical protein
LQKIAQIVVGGGPANFAQVLLRGVGLALGHHERCMLEQPGHICGILFQGARIGGLGRIGLFLRPFQIAQQYPTGRVPGVDLQSDLNVTARFMGLSFGIGAVRKSPMRRHTRRIDIE